MLLKHRLLQIGILLVSIAITAAFWYSVYINRKSLNLSFPTVFEYVCFSVFGIVSTIWAIVTIQMKYKIRSHVAIRLHVATNNEVNDGDDIDWDTGGNT